jgi:activator of 2-hydroxyglutaryl-CoA dehydratase
MNRKCAAGTGAFLEEIALRLDLPVSRLNGLAEHSTKEVSLGSFCTVFTATEILAKIRAGEHVEDIVKGAFRAVIKRIVEMGMVEGALVMTGGVIAHNPLLATLAEEAFHTPALIPPEPQFVGAFGAALLALEKAAGSAPPASEACQGDALDTLPVPCSTQRGCSLSEPAEKGDASCSSKTLP